MHTELPWGGQMEPENEEAAGNQGEATGCPYQVVLAECGTWDTVWRGGNTQEGEHAKAMAIIQEALQLDPQPLQPITGPAIVEGAKHFKGKRPHLMAGTLGPMGC